QDPYLVASHPLVAAIAVQGPATLRISDVISDRDWRNHPTRAAMAEGMGNRSQQLERELGLGTFSGPIIYNYAVNRIGPDFSDRDREVIAMLAPGIARHRQLLVRAASLEALFEQAMHDGPVHAVVVDPAG